jgi:hypothetical protein
VTSGHGTRPLTHDLLKYITPENAAGIRDLLQDFTVNRDFDIPFLANRSRDGKTVYIDRHIPEEMKAGDKPFDPAKTLPWHELSEWFYMHEAKLPYDAAHRLATFVWEKPRVEALGLDWKEYQDAFGGEIEHNEKRVPEKSPPDIDLSPYIDDNDHKTLRELMHAGAKVPEKDVEPETQTQPEPSGHRLVPIEHDPFEESA